MPVRVNTLVRARMTTVATTAAVALATIVVAGCTTGSQATADLPGVDLGPASPTQAGGLSVTLPDGTDRDWSTTALRALPRTSVRAADGSAVTGVALPTLTSYAGPPSTPLEVATMRTSYVVQGVKGRVRLTRAETEAAIGSHPALLTEQADGRIDLVVSQDATTARSVLGVTSVTVDWAAASPVVAAPARGAVAVRLDGSATTSMLAMASLPRLPYEVTVHSASGSRRHLELGVSMASVLKAAKVPMRASTLVTVVSSSGASASVTLGEEMSARKRMGFSFSQDGRALRQPTFIIDGDTSGARIVADVTQLVITSS